MKISEILSRLDFSKKEKYYIHHEFLNEFDIEEFDIDFDKIENIFECIRIITWYCTDSWVGTSVILLNNIPICLSFQSSRKSDEQFEWISKEVYLQTKEILEKAKIIRKKEIPFVKMDKECNDYYHISYVEQLIPDIHALAFFNGEKVNVEKIKSDNKLLNRAIEERVRITFDNGSSKTPLITKLEFPLLGLKDSN